MDKAKKNDLTINKYVDDKDQTLESVVEGEICIELLENLSPLEVFNFCNSEEEQHCYYI